MTDVDLPENLCDLEDGYIRYQSDIGFLVDALVLCGDDDYQPGRPLLVQMVGPSHPDDQPDRIDRYGPDSYSVHAEVWAGEPITEGGDVVALSPGEVVSLIDESDLWPEGQFINEAMDPEGYEKATIGSVYDG